MRAPMPLITLVAAVALVAGCGNQESTHDQASQQAATATQPAGAITGEVVESMNSGGYTYARVESDGKSVWAAGPETTLDTGTEVTFSTKMPMQGFHSETLDRTFDTLYFVGGFEAPGADSGDPHGGMDMMQAMTGESDGSQHGATPEAGVAPGAVTKAAGGHTVAELYAGCGDMVGESVTVRGKVVKFNGGIMGRNWVHVQDGSGDPAAKTHDLLITTDAACEEGDVITATGKVTVDKDFGAGYSYELLLEEASIEVEPATTTGR